MQAVLVAVPAASQVVAFGSLVGDDLGQGLCYRALGKEMPVAKDLSWDREGNDFYVNDFHSVLLFI